MSAERASRLPPASASNLRDTARIIGWALAIYAAAAFVNASLKQNPAASLAVQAVIAEFGVGRLGVAWSDPHGPMPTTSSIARRGTIGALLGAAAAILVLVFTLATRGASIARTTPTPSMLAIGLLTAGLLAMRDELLLRGAVLRALRRSASPYVGLLVSGLAGAAASIGAMTAAMTASATADGGLPWREPLIAGLLAMCFAGLWLRDRGAWLAWGAHVAWLWTSGTLAHGGLVDLRWAPGAWGGGDMNTSTATAVALLMVTIGTVAFGARAGYHPPP